MILILQVFYSVFSGLLLGYAIPNEHLKFGCAALALFCLIPYYFAIKSCRNYKEAYLCGFLQAGSTHLYSSYWLANFKDFAALTLGASALGTAIIGASLALFLYFPYSANSDTSKELKNKDRYKLFDSTSFKILYFACVYTLYEWCKSCGFLGYPWGTISTAIYNWNIVMQIASFTGTYGITFVFALTNALFAEGLEEAANLPDLKKIEKNKLFDLKITASLTGILFLVILIHGGYWELKKLKPQKLLTTIAVQKNIDPWDITTDAQSITISQQLTENQLKELDKLQKEAHLIVWSEGSLSYSFPAANSHYSRNPKDRPLIKFIKENKVPLVAGGSYTKDKKNKIYYNSAIVFDQKGNFRGVYGKNHLVPIAEAIPGMEYPKLKNFMNKVIGISNGWTPGDQYVLFDIPAMYQPNRSLAAVKNINLNLTANEEEKIENQRASVKIATPICYDDAFPDIMRPLYLNGAELFVNLTNDSWSNKKSSEYQHFVVSSYRTIEYRTPMIRVCNGGYTVVLDPKAKVLKDLPLFTADSFWYNVPVYSRMPTIYSKLGNWLPWTIFILFLLYFLKVFKDKKIIKF
ncbi:MAG: apolipoprotein N-acyltransferase [Treponema sp.]|nr:apolipoprotein N-acyltransferase [Treponema sp.]